MFLRKNVQNFCEILIIFSICAEPLSGHLCLKVNGIICALNILNPFVLGLVIACRLKDCTF